jgi:hypothetical protein
MADAGRAYVHQERAKLGLTHSGAESHETMPEGAKPYHQEQLRDRLKQMLG